MRKYVIIVAGGKGLRMGAELPKQFIPINGKPVLMHTLEAFYTWDPLAELILVLPEDHESYWKMLCKEIGCRVEHKLVYGGETRFHSVKNGLSFLTEEKGISTDRKEKALIGVHDGVRPFVGQDVIDNCFENAAQVGNAVPVIPIIDSLREVTDEGNRPVNRADFFAVQTPQVFHSDLLMKAYSQEYSTAFTDDASVVEAMGETINMVPGNRENIKITTPFDLLVARSISERRH